MDEGGLDEVGRTTVVAMVVEMGAAGAVVAVVRHQPVSRLQLLLARNWQQEAVLLEHCHRVCHKATKGF